MTPEEEFNHSINLSNCERFANKLAAMVILRDGVEDAGLYDAAAGVLKVEPEGFSPAEYLDSHIVSASPIDGGRDGGVTLLITDAEVVTIVARVGLKWQISSFMPDRAGDAAITVPSTEQCSILDDYADVIIERGG